MECYATPSRLWRERSNLLFPLGAPLFLFFSLFLNMRGLFEENPLKKNFGITLKREKN